MYFKELPKNSNTPVNLAYINKSQLVIPNAVIEYRLSIGNFVHIPHIDGSVSVVWDDGESATNDMAMKMRRR